MEEKGDPCVAITAMLHHDLSSQPNRRLIGPPISNGSVRTALAVLYILEIFQIFENETCNKKGWRFCQNSIGLRIWVIGAIILKLELRQRRRWRCRGKR